LIDFVCVCVCVCVCTGCAEMGTIHLKKCFQASLMLTEATFIWSNMQYKQQYCEILLQLMAKLNFQKHVILLLKGWFSQKWKFCQYLLTLMLFQPC